MYTKQGDIVNTYPSMINASRDNNIPLDCISKCCLGKNKTAGGFIWKYK